MALRSESSRSRTVAAPGSSVRSWCLIERKDALKKPGGAQAIHCEGKGYLSQQGSALRWLAPTHERFDRMQERSVSAEQ